MAAGLAFALGPDVSFDRKVALRFRYDRGAMPPEKLGIYREVAAEKWTLVSNEWDALGRQVVARVRRFGRYALLADLEAPEISNLQPAEGAVVGPRPEFAARCAIKARALGGKKTLSLSSTDVR